VEPLPSNDRLVKKNSFLCVYLKKYGKAGSYHLTIQDILANPNQIQLQKIVKIMSKKTLPISEKPFKKVKSSHNPETAHRK